MEIILNTKGGVPVKDDHVTKFRWITLVISVKCSRILKDLEYFSAISLFLTVFKTSSSFSSIGGLHLFKPTQVSLMTMPVGYFCE